MKIIFLAIRMNAFFLVMTGLAFPGLIYLIAQILFPYQANGSLIYDRSGNLIGSEIIGQSFSSAKYFHSRPSAAGAGYDAANSSGTNLGPTSAKLIAGITDDPTTPKSDESYAGVSELAVNYRSQNGLQANALVPVDAVTRSGSGLDPHITIANAYAQAKRVASAREMDLQIINQLISNNTELRLLGLFGEPRVNVLKINLSLDALAK